MDILLLEELAPDARAWLGARHSVHYRAELLDDQAELHAALRDVEGVIVPANMKINRALLDLAPRLRAIGRVHDGTENVDFEACQRRQVRVIQTASATVRASAEYLLLTLLTLFRQGVAKRGDASQRARKRRGREINDCVIGLFGLSPPAHMLATMLAPLGARLVGYDPAVHRSSEIWRRLGVQPVVMEEMLAIADAVSLQAIYASRYSGLINERVLGHCKPGQMWTSISRPSIFDLGALAHALQSGRISAFMMDSDDPVLLAPDCPLRGIHHLRVTPRIAPYTEEAILRGSWYLVDRMHEALESPAPDKPAPGIATAI